MTRYFQLPSAAYEQVRAGLDTLYGHPNASAQSCLPDASQWPASGANIAVAVSSAILDRPEVAPQLADLLSNAVATEIDRAAFESLIPEELKFSMKK